MRPDGIVQRTGWRVGRVEGCIEGGELVGEVQTDPSVVGPDRPAADPDDVAGGAQLVEVGGAVRAHARCEQLGLQRRRHQRRTLQLRQCLDQRVETTTFAGNAVPHLDEARVRLGLDRFDLASQHCQRTPPELAQHIGVAILATDAAWPELAVDDAIRRLERGEGTDHPFRQGMRSAAHTSVAVNGPCVRA